MKYLTENQLSELEDYLLKNYVDPKNVDKICFQAAYNPFEGKSLEDVIKEPVETFQDKLFSMIKEKNLDEVEVYKNANITRQAFSKIRSEKDYHPAKNTVFSLAIGMKLSIDETSELLKKAGYSFSSANKAALIVQYFIYHKIYNIDAVNEALEKYGFSAF